MCFIMPLTVWWSEFIFVLVLGSEADSTATLDLLHGARQAATTDGGKVEFGADMIYLLHWTDFILYDPFLNVKYSDGN